MTIDEVADVNSWNMTPATMLEVSARAEAALAEDGVDGAVVAHGTDTIEETAFLCDLTIRSEKPVCFAGAMRSPSEVGADGPRNLLAAVTVASDPGARGLGTVLALGDELHAARWVRKQDTFRPLAFSSPDRGPIAFVTPSSLRIRTRPAARFTCARPPALDRPVPVIQTYTGMEDHLIAAVLDATGAAGLVLEGTGAGNAPHAVERGVRAAVERGLPVVVATRVPGGGTIPGYGGPGGGATLRRLGAVLAGGLTAAKARLLLMLLLANGAGHDEVLGQFQDAVEALG